MYADIILTDIRMPVMDGIELARQARELHSDIQFIFLTSYDDVEFMKSAISLNVVAYLSKPFRMAALEDAMKEAIDRRNLLRSAEVGQRQMREEKLMRICLGLEDDAANFEGAWQMFHLEIGRFLSLYRFSTAAQIKQLMEEVKSRLYDFLSCRCSSYYVLHMSKGQFLILADPGCDFSQMTDADEAELDESLGRRFELDFLFLPGNPAVEAASFFIHYRQLMNMREQMESYALKELDFAMEQSTTQIQTGLDNLQSIMYTNLTDVQLWRRLSYEYEDTMDTWELYDYVNNFYATLLAMDDNIALVTIYVDNPTISEDKTYIRHYDFFKTLPVYDRVRADNGAVSLFAMKDVFPEEYYTYNTISSRDNFCLIRSFTYRGMDYGVVLEFSRDLFTDQLTTLHGHQTYLLNGAGEIAMYYDGSADRSGDVFGQRFADVVQHDSSRKRLGLG